ncbi:MAG: CBS domain-containing protein [Pseudohongiellaceae bacterium]
MNVNEIMTADVASCSSESNLEEIARLMWDRDCGAIPVVNHKGNPVGIVTDRDIAMAAMLNHKPLWEIGAEQVIQGQRLCTCEQEDSVAHCLTKMEQNGIRRMPIVDAKGHLAGIVSMGDAVAFAAKAGNSRQKQKAAKGVPVQELVDMLQHVSAHHAAKKQAVTRAS